ncbi:unnamed protein product [Mortierella alpina]
MLVKCWDVNPVKRLKIHVVIAILQTLMAKPTEPVHQVATGYTVPSNTSSAALPVPPELSAKMATLERASNTLNTMVFDIKDLSMRETVSYIDRTRAYFREQQIPPEPYSPQNPPKTPIYLCPLVGDLAALSYYLSHQAYNPINESSEQTGDTALHLACLFLESPMDTIKVLVELGADINLENLQGYTPVMILVSSNTQYCYEALKYFVMRGARIPAYIRNPITPLNSAQIYALNLVNESRQIHMHGVNNATALMSTSSISGAGGVGAMPERVSGTQRSKGGSSVCARAAIGPCGRGNARRLSNPGLSERGGTGSGHVLWGETALVAAAAHLRIKNVEWLLNHDLDISTEAGINRAIKVVKLLHASLISQENGGLSLSSPPNSGHGHTNGLTNGSGTDKKDHLENIRDLGKYSWAGVAYGEADRMSRDMVGPVLQLLEQWTGNRRITKRKEVATRLQLMYGYRNHQQEVQGPAAGVGSAVSLATSAYSNSSNSSQGSNGGGGGGAHYIPQSQQHQQQYHQQQHQHQHQQQHSSYGRASSSPVGPRSLRKNQHHLIDQVLNEKSWFR